MLKSAIRRLIPEPIISGYHLALAHLAAAVYGYPSRRLTVIGVTGTNGKSSTTQFIGRLLEHAGHRVGWTTTAGFKVADREWVNDKKMTMLGRFQTQKLLREMVKAGCTHAIVETSSQGIAQFRHVGIAYTVAVFTNLTPEHIEAHGGFENYKRAKGKLFAATRGIHIINIDDEHAPYFLSFKADKTYGYGLAGASQALPRDAAGVIPVIASDVLLEASCSSFRVDGHEFHLTPIGRFNVYNVLSAVATCRALGLSWEIIQDGVARLESVPGRLESIEEGQGFGVIVDYAYEPAAMNAVYEALRLLKRGRLIQVLGSAGGGRDVARREILGRMAAQEADVVIVANEDPYDDDPMQIINDVASGATAEGKRDGVDLFRILDRQEAIDKAIAMAQSGDLVLLTGKGSEPVMAVENGKKIPWDDRAAARKALHRRVQS